MTLGHGCVLLALAAAAAALLPSNSAQPLLNALRTVGLYDGPRDNSSSGSSVQLSAAASVTAAATAGTHYCRMEKSAEHSFCGLPYELSNFQGHFKCNKPVLVGRPSDWQQLARLVQFYPKVKAVGVGCSFWREQFCSGTNSSAINIVTTELSTTLPAMQGHPEVAITIDETAMTATVAAGVTQRTLLKFLDNYRTASSPEGYTLPAFSWFIDQTMGGAVSTATHGSSFIYGSLSSQLRALTIMDADGTIHKLTPASNPHLWKAATVSVGRMGIILDLTIAIVKNNMVKRDKADISVPEFVDTISQLQSSFNAAAAGNHSMLSLAVWQAVKPWNELQLFWFIASRMLWKVSYTRIDPIDDATALDVMAMDGSPDDGSGPLPEGAHAQMEVDSAGSGIGIETNPLYWSEQYRVYLAANVAPATLPARESYVSISELENRMYAGWNSYNQYEVAIPLSKSGDCIKAVQQELYGPSQRWQGFRSPPLVRFIRAEQPYISPANGEHVMYINLEDHLAYTAQAPNKDFLAIMQVFHSPVCGPARLHWGKAGWPSVKCFDGAKEYPNTWCDFGCAVQLFDPHGKFSAEAGSSIWQWSAVDSTTGAAVASFAQCCSTGGFDHARCKCATRNDCVGN